MSHTTLIQRTMHLYFLLHSSLGAILDTFQTRRDSSIKCSVLLSCVVVIFNSFCHFKSTWKLPYPFTLHSMGWLFCNISNILQSPPLIPTLVLLCQEFTDIEFVLVCANSRWSEGWAEAVYSFLSRWYSCGILLLSCGEANESSIWNTECNAGSKIECSEMIGGR